MLLLVLVLASSGTMVVTAHGKEVNLTVTPLFPEPNNPFVRLYRVSVFFEDGDPVEDAVMAMSAQRSEGGQTIGPVPFHSLGEPGLYATEVTYDRFGAWIVTVTATEPGEGEATFTDEVLPGATAGEVARENESAPAPIAEELAILFRFDGRDLLNIVFRFVHSLSGLAWFGLLGVFLVARWFMSAEARLRTLARLQGLYAPAAFASLAILVVSGIYNAIWDTPIRAPGVFDLETMLQIPFGDVYMAAFAGKIAAYLLLVWITFRLRAILDGLPSPESTAGAGTGAHDAAQATTRPALVGVGTAVFLAVDIAVLIYMHYISHLSIFIP